ncbi:serine/arginine repetitive matrix protein 1-like [Phacochoerus africanus]|uniref:serine/arginine repetitive matrix protein 1-like n=1 Tax=Phacochoerus africanus TaxID=41426 RepID=UPI001FD9ED0B|nr:serine/arginine repetitive matrix protein 1-like [Phacochoerus africanus]
MKEADLEQLLHRPRVPTPSGAEEQQAKAGRAPGSPSPRCRTGSGPFPGKLRPTAVPAQAGEALKIPCAGVQGPPGGPPRCEWRQHCGGFFPGGAEGSRAPPPQRTLGGYPGGENPCAAPSPRDRSPAGPARTTAHSSPSCPNPNSVSGAKLWVRQRGSKRLREEERTRPRGGGKSAPAPPQTASETHLPPPPLAAENLGAFMAPPEEGSQTERLSPLRHPSLSPSPFTHAHLQPLASGRSPATKPPPSTWLRSRNTQTPPFLLNTSPPPPFGAAPLNAEMSPPRRQTGEATSQEPRRIQALANETYEGGRGRDVCGLREPS